MDQRRPTRQNMNRRRMYTRRRRFVGGGLLLFCTLLVLAAQKVVTALPLGQAAPAVKSVSVHATTSKPQASLGSTRVKSLGPASSPRSPTSPGTAPQRPAPIRATGEYARVSGGTGRHGSGSLMTYSVEVETGTGQSAPAFAAAVDATLANPASWVGQGRSSFQRINGGDGDFVIRLATPATVDKVCATVGLATQGYVSCQAGRFVMINLDRWLKAVPEYRGDVALYRQYVINHEVGHLLGLSHQSCPGPGRPAPVMQQQTFGLNGCVPNGWP